MSKCNPINPIRAHLLMAAVVVAGCLAAGCAKKSGQAVATGNINTPSISYGTFTDTRD